MRILILRGGALGDFLVTLPALALLRQRWPDARLELVGNSTAASLAVSCGLLTAVHSQHESRWSALYGSDPLPAPLASWLAEFDLVVSYWPDPQRELATRFPLHPRQTFLSATALPTQSPAAAHYAEPLRALSTLTFPFTFTLTFPLRTPAPGPALVALHPGSGSPRKNWPADRWRALAQWLEQDLHQGVLIISGEAEPADLLADIGVPLRNFPLNEVADQLARCRFFIGHDSGISHLAAATGTPCLLLFGPTDPAMWAPPAPHVRVLRHGADLTEISLADVQQAISSALRDRK